MTLVILDGEVTPLAKRGMRCSSCKEQQATLWASLRDGDGSGAFCAHCVLYSGKTQWGHDNRDEILDIGRAAQELAGKHGKPMPVIDERGRLFPEDANRFMLGVIFTEKMLGRFGAR